MSESQPPKPPAKRQLRFAGGGTQPKPKPKPSLKTLAEVARQFHITTASLREANLELRSLKDDEKIPPGARIVLPKKPGAKSSPKNEKTEEPAKSSEEEEEPVALLENSSRADPEGESPPAPITDPAEMSVNDGSMTCTPEQSPRVADAKRSFEASPSASFSASLRGRTPQAKATAPPHSPKEKLTRLTLATIAEKHEFFVDEVREANPALEQFTDDQPIPAGIKITLPKRKRPKLSALISQLCDEETEARQTIINKRRTDEQEKLTRWHDQTHKTILDLRHMYRDRRLALLAGIVEFEDPEEGSKTPEQVQEEKAAQEEYDSLVTMELLDTIVKEARAADEAYLQKRTPIHNLSTGKPSTSTGEKSSLFSTAALHWEFADPLSWELELGNTERSANTQEDTPDQTTEPASDLNPFESVSNTVGKLLRDAMATERRQLLHHNMDVIKSMFIRKQRLLKFEKSVERRFEELISSKEELMWKEILQSRSEEVQAVEAEERSARVEIERERSHEVNSHYVAMMQWIIGRLTEAHSHRWMHQVRVEAQALTVENTPHPASPTTSRSQQTDQEETAIQEREEDAASAERKSDEQDDSISEKKSDERDDKPPSDDRDDKPPSDERDDNPTTPEVREDDEASTANEVKREPTVPESDGREVPEDRLEAQEQVSRHQEMNPNTHGSPTDSDDFELDDKADERSKEIEEEKEEAPPVSSPNANRSTPEPETRTSTVNEMEQPSVSTLTNEVVEDVQEPRRPTPPPRRSVVPEDSVFEYCPCRTMRPSAVAQADDFDLQINRTTAEHVGFGPNARGVALLKVLPSNRTTVIAFRHKCPAQAQASPKKKSSSGEISASAPASHQPHANPRRSRYFGAVHRQLIQLFVARNREGQTHVPPPQTKAVNDDGTINMQLELERPPPPSRLPSRDVVKLECVARVAIPPQTANFTCEIDMETRSLILRDADNDVVSRDCRWTSTCHHEPHEAFRLGVSLAVSGSSVEIL